MFGAFLLRLVQVLTLAYNGVRFAVQTYGWRRVLLTVGAVVLFFWLRPFLPQIGQWFNSILTGAWQRGENGAHTLAPRVWNGFTAGIRGLLRGIWQAIRATGQSIVWGVFRGLDFYGFWIASYAVLGVGLALWPSFWGVVSLVSLPFVLTIIIPCFILAFFWPAGRWWLVSIGLVVLVLTFLAPWMLARFNPFALFEAWVRFLALVILLLLARIITRGKFLRRLYGVGAMIAVVALGGHTLWHNVDGASRDAKARGTEVNTGFHRDAAPREWNANHSYGRVLRTTKVDDTHIVVYDSFVQFADPKITDAGSGLVEVLLMDANGNFSEKVVMDFVFLEVHSGQEFKAEMVKREQSRNATTAATATRPSHIQTTADIRPAGPATSTDCLTGPPQYVAMVDKWSDHFGVPRELVLALITGSENKSWDPTARSTADAVGIMQLKETAAARYGVTDRTDPDQNIMGGTHYLADMSHKYRDPILAIAAYAAGEGRLAEIMAAHPSAKTGEELLPFLDEEQRVAIPKVLAALEGNCGPSPAALVATSITPQAPNLEGVPASRQAPAGTPTSGIGIKIDRGADVALWWINYAGAPQLVGTPKSQLWWSQKIVPESDVFLVCDMAGNVLQKIQFPAGGNFTIS